MHSFSQAGMLARKDLVKRIAAHSHKPTTFTPGSWAHETNETSFTRVVDDFGIKITSISSLKHLFDFLKKIYSITINMEGNLHIGVSLE